MIPPHRRRLLLVTLPVAIFLVLAAWFGEHVSAQLDPAAPVSPDSAQMATSSYQPLLDSSGAPLPDGATIPGQWIVVFQDADLRAASGDATSAADLAQNMVAAAGGEMLFVYDAVLEGFAARLSEEGIAAIAADPQVAYVQPDRVVSIGPLMENGAVEGEVASAEGDAANLSVPDASQRPATWGLDRVDQRNLPLDNTFNYQLTGQGVHLYVVDSGIRPTHTEFTSRLIETRSWINDGNGVVDCNGHGTHVAGTAAGTTYGVAKKASIHAMRVLDCEGSGTTSGVIAALNWIRANHVKPAVINMSLGAEGSDTAEETAVRNLVAAGVTVVVAAGNDRANACGYSPAAVPEAITVGNSTVIDQRAVSSNWGSCLDIFAPGTDITSAWNTGDSATETISGTSMASPHVAGAAAAFLQAYPSASPAQVVAALTGNATSGKITSLGSGSPNLLLYTGFIAAPSPTATSTPIPGKQILTVYIQPKGTPPRPTPVVTPTRTPTRTPTATTAPACTNLVVEPGFENGGSAWSQSSTNGVVQFCTSSSCGETIDPYSGTWMSWLGGLANEEAYVWQEIAIPAGQPAFLSYWYLVDSGEESCGYDRAASFAGVSGVNTTLVEHDLCTSNRVDYWRQQVVNMASYAGKTVEVQLGVLTDGSVNSNFFVDDVYLRSGAGCVVAAEAGAVVEPENLVWPLSVSVPGPKGQDSGTPTYERQK